MLAGEANTVSGVLHSVVYTVLLASVDDSDSSKIEYLPAVGTLIFNAVIEPRVEAVACTIVNNPAVVPSVDE
jgi:hypothetical protein